MEGSWTDALGALVTAFGPAGGVVIFAMSLVIVALRRRLRDGI